MYSSLYTSIMAFCLSTSILYVIERPIPVPTLLFFVVKYGSKILWISSFGIPPPLSFIKTTKLELSFKVSINISLSSPGFTFSFIASFDKIEVE